MDEQSISLLGQCHPQKRVLTFSALLIGAEAPADIRVHLLHSAHAKVQITMTMIQTPPQPPHHQMDNE